MLIYIGSSVALTGTTKETHRLHLETEPLEVQTRHRDVRMQYGKYFRRWAEGPKVVSLSQAYYMSRLPLQ